MKLHQDILNSFAFFTRLPLTRFIKGNAPLSSAVWTFPLVGAVIGFATVELYHLLHFLRIMPKIACLLLVTFQLLLTGAIHEDGLADTVDGFAGGKDKASRLAIMRDSRIGAFGTLALILSLALRTFALTLIIHPGIFLPVCIAAGVLSRSMIAAAMYALPSARTDGLAASAGRPSLANTAICLALAFAITGWFLHMHAFEIIPSAIIACALVCLIAKKKIGGVTGDVYGAIQQIVEVTVLITATATL